MGREYNADQTMCGTVFRAGRFRGVGTAKSRPRSRSPTTTYDRQLEVTPVVDGIPVKLALQERTSAEVEKPWWTLSWRTKYSPDGSNRRFYLTKDGCWTIPAAIAKRARSPMPGDLGHGLFAFKEVMTIFDPRPAARMAYCRECCKTPILDAMPRQRRTPGTLGLFSSDKVAEKPVSRPEDSGGDKTPTRFLMPCSLGIMWDRLVSLTDEILASLDRASFLMSHFLSSMRPSAKSRKAFSQEEIARNPIRAELQ